MKLFSFRWFYCAALPLYLGGGGGSSSSTQTQQTSNTDARVVGGANSANISASDSTVNLQLTDAGAVSSSFDFAKQAMAGAYDFAIGAQHDTAAVEQQATAAIQDAYSTAKAGEQKVLVAAVFGIIGVVAFAAVRKG